MDREHIIWIKRREQAAKKRKHWPIRPHNPSKYLARRKSLPVWEFFDLGTRLRTVDSASEYDQLTIPLDSTDQPAVDGDGYLLTDKVLEYAELAYDSAIAFGEREMDPALAYGNFDFYSTGPQHLDVGASDPDEVLSWDTYTLGQHAGAMDPFGYSQYREDEEHPTPRRIAHCMPLPYGFGTIRTEAETETDEKTGGFTEDTFDITLRKKGTTETTTLPNALYRESVDDLGLYAFTDDPVIQEKWDTLTRHANPYWDYPRDKNGDEVVEPLAGENWNPRTLYADGEETDSKSIKRRGVMDMRTPEPRGSGIAGARYDLVIESRVAYMDFDTGDDDNFEITKQNTDGTTTVVTDFSVSPNEALKIYLVPKMLGWFRRVHVTVSTPIAWNTYRITALTGEFGFNIYNLVSAIPFAGPNSVGAFHHTSSLFTAVSDSTVPNRVVTGEIPSSPVETAVLSMDCETGAWSITGYISGGGQAELVGTDLWAINSAIVEGFAISGYDAFKTSTPTTAAIDIMFGMSAYANNTSVSSNFYLARGGFVGRMSVYPRALPYDLGAGMTAWASPYDWNGSQDFDSTMWNGEIFHYDAATAETLPGRFLSPTMSLSDTNKLYFRHTNVDHTDRVWYASTNFSGDYFDDTDTDAAHTAYGEFYDLDLEMPPGSELTEVLRSFGRDQASAIIAEMGLQENVTNETLNGATTVTYADGGLAIGQELPAKTGQLCAVVVKGSTKYYVRRKTDKTFTGTYDYEKTRGYVRMVGDFDDA